MYKKITISAVLAIGLLIFCLSGCKTEEEDLSISRITIYNLPIDVPLNDNSGTDYPLFKVYINASNYMDDLHNAEAYGFITSDLFVTENGKYTATINLFKANAGTSILEYASGIPFSGTAKYFSIMLSPENLHGNGVDAIWVKGSMEPLNKARERVSWEPTKLMDFRDPDLASLQLPEKALSMYTNTIDNDTEITP